MLTIEKLIKLLDDFHLDSFKEHLKENGYEHPLKLVRAIDRNILEEQNSNELCKKVYGNDTEKNRKKFFQLAHYTFKLSSFLSKNYPNYLLVSIGDVQKFLNSGQPKEGHAILEVSKELAEKIEDYKSLIIILGILSQEAHINEAFHEAHKYQLEIQSALKEEQKLSEIYSILNQKFHPKKKPTISNNQEFSISFFKPFTEADSFAVSILGKYGYCYAAYFHNSDKFYSEQTLSFLLEIEEQLIKYNYIVFPYLENLSYKINYLKIRYLFHEMEESLVLKESKQFLDNSDKVLFWNSFVNVPELFAIAFQTSFYVTRHLTSYRDDHLESLPEEVKLQINRLKNRCKDLINNPGWNEQFILKLINLKTIYSLLLLLGNKEDIKLSVQNLEMTLVEYQQIPFHFFTDGIFTNIVVGYFCLKDYENVVNSYKRYKKISEGKTVIIENDLTIHGFYYASQWLYTERKQYASKFSSVIAQTNKPNLKSTQSLLLKLADFVGLKAVGEV